MRRRVDVTADEIARLLADGMDRRQVAAHLGVSLDLVYRRMRDAAAVVTRVDPTLLARLGDQVPTEGGVPPWIYGAPCGEDPDMWFPKYAADSGPAVAVCKTCPHRLPCLTWALHEDIEEGIWGGLTERQRRKLKTGAPA